MKKLTTQSFIDKANQVHGDKYDYSYVRYKNSKTKVKIVCPIHGVFEQQVGHHTNGSGCPDCGVIKRARNNTYNTDQFIVKAKQVHGDKYDYSLVEYNGCRDGVKIVCPIHGVFEQMPYSHLKGAGCKHCGNNIKLTTDDFITKAKQVHGDKYDYSLVEYKTAHTKVKIICPIHGVFEQTPNNHTSKRQWCPECMKKTSHQEISFVNHIKRLYKGKVVTNTRSVIPPYELDVYLPDLQMAFEYNGTYWHKEGVNVPVGYHQMKTDMCSSVGIELHHIWEQDWTGNRDEVIELIYRRVI